MLEYGRIIVATVVSNNGTEVKDRPCIIVSTPEEIEATGQIKIVPISGETKYTRDEHNIKITSRPDGRCVSKLTGPSWAICEWPNTINRTAILRWLGKVPVNELRDVSKSLGILAEEAAKNGPQNKAAQS